jgi:glycosyltransferase involved in cell wall biosynthesis
MRLLLLNQFIPPNAAPTARLLGDLASACTTAGWDTVYLGKASGYHQGGTKGLSRVFRDALAHVKLLWAGLRAGPCDWIVCLSDPPGLPFTAALLARIKRARLVHWAMDVYPQVAVRLGALPDGLPSRLVAAAMRQGYRRCDLLVALDEDMRQVLANCGGTQIQILPPWPPPLHTLNPTPRVPTKPDAMRTWLYSGNLGRAHEYSDLLQAQLLLESQSAPWQLVFQGGGPCRNEAQAQAQKLGLKHCLWQDYVPEDQLLDSLLAADVLIATQKESLLGLLWPSKLAVMKQIHRPILWIGPPQGQIAADLRAASSVHGVFAPGMAGAIATWLVAMPWPNPKAVPEAHAIAQEGQRMRELGLAQFTQWLRPLETDTPHVA